MRSIYLFLGLSSLMLGVVIGQGCQSTTPTDSNNAVSIDPVQSLRYTGRDSLIARSGGVGLIGKMSGELQQTEHQECTSPGVFLSGTGAGHVTHLGQTVVEQTACINEDDGTVWGTFVYEGKSGSRVSGTYEGTLVGDELGADATVETADVEAPLETPPAGENWGGGRIVGTMTASHFDYEFIGWLFHHNTEK